MFRREILNQWLVAVTLHLVLFQIAGELKEKNDVLPEKYLKSDVSLEKGLANRLIFVVIEGLRWDVFYTMSNISKFPTLLSVRGTVGPLYTNIQSNDHRGLVRMTTGVSGSGSDNSTNIFHLVKTIYIGPSSVRNIFGNLKECYCYPEVWENLTANPNETKGDEWVFHKWNQLLSNSSLNGQDKILYFFYLNGIDMASRLEGPLSYRAVEEMRYVMDSLEKVYRNTEEFFLDSKTAYIVTSDYGFFDDEKETLNSLNETLVPFLAWGAGMASASEITAEDATRLSRKGFVRHEDLVPLMCYLLATAIPPNCFGDAPVIRLSRNEDRAKLLFLNAKQLTALFQSFEKAYGFGLASLCAPLNKNYIDKCYLEIEESLLKKDYYLAISKCQEVIDLALDGISYFRNYEFNILWICAVVSLIGWTAVTLGWVMEKVKITPVIQREMISERQEDEEHTPAKNKTILQRLLTPFFVINAMFFLIFCTMIGILIFISAPSIVSLAIILATTMSWLAAKSSLDWMRLYKTVSFDDLRIKKGKPLMHLAYFLVFSCCLSLPIVLQVMFSFAIMFSALSDLRHSTGAHLAYWMLSSLSYLILLHYTFYMPYLPLLVIAAMVWIIGGGIFLHCLKVGYTDWPIFLVAFFSIALISIHSQYAPSSTEENLILRWTPIIIVFFVPLIGSSSLSVRLFQLCLCLAIPVFSLSLSFEAISLIVIVCHIFSWALLEGYSNVTAFFSSTLHFSVGDPFIVWNDIRRTLYFLAYVLTSFLVIGNSCDITNWPNEWSAYFRPTSELDVFMLVCFKSLPIILIDNIFFALLEKNSSTGYLSLVLHLSSQASLVNFIIFPESSVTLYNQLIFLLSLLLKPIAYLFLTPSLFSILTRSGMPNAREGRSPEIRQTMTVETSL